VSRDVDSLQGYGKLLSKLVAALEKDKKGSTPATPSPDLSSPAETPGKDPGSPLVTTTLGGKAVVASGHHTSGGTTSGGRGAE
jgi:hypothetical protein